VSGSKVEVCNMALSHLGIGKTIGNLDTEKSQEAISCRLFFDRAMNATLRDCEWSFATKTVTLSLVEEDPTDEWAFSYRYPSDCKYFRRILSGIRNDSRQTKVSYRVVSDTVGQLIYTDEEDAIAEYTKKIETVANWPDDFVLALSARIAVYISPRLTAGDPFKMGDRALRLYLSEIGLAQAATFNEQQEEEAPDAESVRARDT
jgi:hypothetical protein